MDTATQEPRSERIGIAVTRAEKDAIEMVAKVRRSEGGVSGLLRSRPFADVVAEGERIMERLAEEVA